MANAVSVEAAGPFAQHGAASDRNPGGLSSVGRRPPDTELYEVYQPMLYPSITNNPVLTVPANFGGQDGLSNYPIQDKYARYNAGVGQMYDTRDFVNHNLDSRSNDYTPRAVPDPSTVSYTQIYIFPAAQRWHAACESQWHYQCLQPTLSVSWASSLAVLGILFSATYVG